MQPLCAAADDAAPDAPERRCRDDAGGGGAVGDEAYIDRVLVAAGDELARAVERIDENEAGAAMLAPARSALSSEMTGSGSPSRARPSRITASAASSAAVTGEPSALSRTPLSASEPRIASAAAMLIAVISSRSAAQAAESKLDTGAPGFRPQQYRGAPAKGEPFTIARRKRHDCRIAPVMTGTPLASCSSGAAHVRPVSGPIAVGALDLAALLCSRVCHDLISPVGAIVNGIEVLDEGKDEETKTFALDLIRKSAAQASAKLQFCRMAFGAAGSAGAQIELGDAEKTARGLLEDGKTTLV